MGFNKDGYDDTNEMDRALPRAIGIKREEGIQKRIAEERAGRAPRGRRQSPRKESYEGVEPTREQPHTKIDEHGMKTVNAGMYGGKPPSGFVNARR